MSGALSLHPIHPSFLPNDEVGAVLQQPTGPSPLNLRQARPLCHLGGAAAVAAAVAADVAASIFF